jgi:hypothetical protein
MTSFPEEEALIALDRLEENWSKKYYLSIRNWANASTFFKYYESFTLPTLLRLRNVIIGRFQSKEVSFPTITY